LSTICNSWRCRSVLFAGFHVKHPARLREKPRIESIPSDPTDFTSAVGNKGLSICEVIEAIGAPDRGEDTSTFRMKVRQAAQPADVIAPTEKNPRADLHLFILNGVDGVSLSVRVLRELDPVTQNFCIAGPLRKLCFIPD